MYSLDLFSPSKGNITLNVSMTILHLSTSECMDDPPGLSVMLGLYSCGLAFGT